MDQPAQFDLRTKDGARWAVLSGDWTAASLGRTATRLAEALKGETGVHVDLTGVGRCDTAGAFAILRAGGDRMAPEGLVAAPQVTRLIDFVRRVMPAEPTPFHRPRSLRDMLERLGRGVINIGHEFYGTTVFLGHLLVVIGRVASHPRRIRWAACFSLAERAGLDAVPIVTVATFFIGIVVGFIGANQLLKFGAQVFAVELIGIAIMREFNIVITAVLLAGRSASSFAAEIGSMKMNQEIDAMLTLGVDPFEALVLPRFLALLVTIPLLTFMATIAGLAGGIVVSWMVLDLSPAFFLQRLTENVGINHFWVGLSKAPVMAVTVAGIGCRQGMLVGGDVESLGRRVTTAVVHAIFAIILIDAAFAVLYMKLDI